MQQGWLGVLLAVAALPMARAGEAAGPVCARPAVLERVGTLLSEAGRKVRLDARTTGELSTGTGRVVHCAVRGRVLGYDTLHYGMQPIDDSFVVQYTLELRQNGIFLRLE